jgi:hypothetical protein
MNKDTTGAEGPKTAEASQQPQPEAQRQEWREVVKEAVDYLGHETFEFGKPVLLNSIGGGSILHRKLVALLAASTPAVQPDPQREDGQIELTEPEESRFVDWLVQELPKHGVDTSEWEYKYGDCCYGGAAEFIARAFNGAINEQDEASNPPIKNQP